MAEAERRHLCLVLASYFPYWQGEMYLSPFLFFGTSTKSRGISVLCGPSTVGGINPISLVGVAEISVLLLICHSFSSSVLGNNNPRP